MANLTIDNIANFLDSWCKNKVNEFKFFFPLKGGWEAWVQADFAAFLLSQNSTYEILREQQIFIIPRQKVDWLFNSSSSPTDKIVVELKCQSFENQSGFTRGIQADIDKLDSLNINVNYNNCQRLVVGIYFEEIARTWMLSNGFIELFNNGEVGCAIKEID